MKRLGIYVHIPFCARKCNYCDFYSLASGEDEKKNYIEALKREIKEVSKKVSTDYEVYTIYFGGGTPSIIKADYIREILDVIRSYFKLYKDDFYPEITIECNPKTVDTEKLSIYSEAGINRVSLGLQSTDNDELKLLGRIHTYEDFLESYEMVRKSGFKNVNIDLMSAIPNQKIKTYEKSLNEIIRLNPEHISSYSLIIEEGTPFFKKYSENAPHFKDLPSEDEDREMYALTSEKLGKAGYERYEISNYAKPGFYSRHNTSYWERVPYLGFGVGASSFFEDERYKNRANFKEYIKKAGIEDIREEITKLTLNDTMTEFMFLGLRKTAGISKSEFKKIFTFTVENVFGKMIEKHIKNGLLLNDGEFLKLSERGLDISNYVISYFLLD
ncbi:putative oxygen-independent coproporphyrinogen III oxidase [Catonella morbi ATCC 51271]|uniref:Heme chaperone HemW n=1 Tax=Catonella morbi ATCC 51271 TaxID=592026 RepID=V2Y690_9FIRM|nr:radical SAM family heme chaperone HemW [Catonella morbi]ESL04473.1 putative oxygen-independent coproporphyrinogen III oxidase [Catonella morbi ATCC 51271]